MNTSGKKNLLSEEHLCANALPVGTSIISITDVSVSFTHHTLQKQESLLTGYLVSDSLLVTSCWLHGRSPYLGYLVRPLNGCKKLSICDGINIGVAWIGIGVTMRKQLSGQFSARVRLF